MIVGVVVFRLAHGFSARLLADRFGVGASTIRKYVDLVVRVLSYKQFFLNIYLHLTDYDCSIL